MRRIIAATLGLGLTATIALAQEDPDPGIVSPLPDPAADVVIEDAQDGAPAGPPPLTGGTDAAPPVADDAPPTDGTTDDGTAAGDAPAAIATEPAGTDPTAAEPTITSSDRFTDWQLQCGLAAGSEQEVCVAYTQNGGETTGGMVVARLSLTAARDTGDPVVILDLTRTGAEDTGIRLRVDRRTPWVAELRDCTETSCRLVIGGEQATRLAGEFRRGSRAAVTFLLGDGSPVTVLLSLMGFTAAATPILQPAR